jgi:hypothetical protein
MKAKALSRPCSLENQTKAEGQLHGFPAIWDGKKMYEMMLTKFPPDVYPNPPLEVGVCKGVG